MNHTPILLAATVGLLAFASTWYVRAEPATPASPGEPASPPAQLPMTGSDDPAGASFDAAMQAYMQARHIGAGTLAVRYNNELVYEKAYGYADAERTMPLRPDALFRLASVTKPITAAAIRCLIADGKLKLDDKVLDVLQLEPLPGVTLDPRFAEVTIEQLLYHRGGFDRAKGVEPTFSLIQIADAMDLDQPPTQEQLARFMLGQPLQFDPGADRIYSNFGYLLLGLVIEKRSGMTYEKYVQQRVMEPLGITDVHLGHTLLKDRREGEVWYHHPDTARCVVDFTITEPVSWAYGGFSVEAQCANGGLIARARDVATFMETYEARGNPARPNVEWLHYGGMPGTFTMAYCRKDGIKIVALFNQRGGGNDPALRDEDIKDALDKAADAFLAAR